MSDISHVEPNSDYLVFNISFVYDVKVWLIIILSINIVKFSLIYIGLIFMSLFFFDIIAPNFLIILSKIYSTCEPPWYVDIPLTNDIYSYVLSGLYIIPIFHPLYSSYIISFDFLFVSDVLSSSSSLSL